MNFVVGGKEVDDLFLETKDLIVHRFYWVVWENNRDYPCQWWRWWSGSRIRLDDEETQERLPRYEVGFSGGEDGKSPQVRWSP